MIVITTAHISRAIEKVARIINKVVISSKAKRNNETKIATKIRIIL